MARGEQYLTYEQVLQELQINRTQLNHLVREGALREHAIEGETKFRLTEVEALKKELEKRPTVSEEAIGEPATDIVGEDKTYVPDGQTVTRTIQQDAPLGTHECPTRCDKDPDEPPTTPPVDLIVE